MGGCGGAPRYAHSMDELGVAPWNASRGIHYKLQATSYKLQATRYKIQDTRYKIQDTRYKIQDTRYSGRFAHPPACPGATMPRRRRLDQRLRAMAHSATRDEEGRRRRRGEREGRGGEAEEEEREE